MPSNVVALDERYVYTFTAYYGIAGIWGLIATTNGIQSIYATAGSLVETVFTFSLTIISGLLAILTTTEAACTEKFVTLLWMSVVVIFPAAAIYQGFAENDPARAGGAVSTLLYLVFPFARYIYLSLKTRKTAKKDG